MSATNTGTEETLAVWAFEAAMNGLPESEALELLEGDRYPEPGTPEWTASVASVRVTDGGFAVYDPDDERAWIQSDTTRDLAELR